MTATATFRDRLASTDPASLRRAGAAADELRRGLLRGARIAVIEPGYVSKRFLYERAGALGVELVLVGDGESWARAFVDEGVAARFVDADSSGDPELAARAVLDALGDEAQKLDGVVTYWEDAVSATARLAASLGLPGMPVAAADGARSKLRTLQASQLAGLPTPRFMHLDDVATLPAAAAHVGFPAVIKPESGAEALGCLRVDDVESLEAGYERVAALITPELNSIFEQGCDLLLEEYLDGPEFDVEFVLNGGACVFSAVSENWPTHEPYFVDLRDGVVHAEAKDTAAGPRMLELNARLGGGSIVDNHRLVTGIDLVEQQLLVTLGRSPSIAEPRRAHHRRSAPL